MIDILSIKRDLTLGEATKLAPAHRFVTNMLG